MSRDSYESLYRRTVLVMSALPGLMVALGISVAVSIRFIEDGNMMLAVILYALGAVVLLAVAVAVSSLRVHRWTIEAQGVRIEERPKIPFTGIRRRALVTFPDIVALRNVESGLDFLIEVAARDGKIFRLSQIRLPRQRGADVPDEARSVEAFADEIRAAAARAGHRPPSKTEGLSFWNRPPGLFLVATLFAISLAFASVTAWALWGGGLGVSARSGTMAGIAIFLPVGAGYWFYRSLKRRRTVLRARQVG